MIFLIRLLFCLVIFNLVTFSSTDLLAQVCYLTNQSPDSLLKLQKAMQKIDKFEQVKLTQNNPSQLCEKNMLLRFINANPKDAKDAEFKCSEMSEIELKAYADTILIKQLQQSNFSNGTLAWNFSLIPTNNSQELSFLMGESESLEKIEPILRSLSSNKVEARKQFSSRVHTLYLEQLEANESFLSQKRKEKKDSSNIFEKLTQSSEAVSKSWDSNIAVKAALCSDLKFSATIGCTQALEKILELAKPSEIRGLSFMPALAWKKVISSKDIYAEGLRLAALKMNRMLSKNDSSNSNVFDDLKDAFVQSGLSKIESTNAAYDILALYGNSGANLGPRADELLISNNGFGKYLNIIGKAIPLLDTQNNKAGKRLYSFPPGVEASCNTNKSYHFWMAAYLAREAVKLGFSSESSEIASYASAVAYQFNRDKGTSQDKIKVGANALNKSSFDPVSNIIRTDLAYAVNGAKYGSQKLTDGGNKSLSIDKTLLKLMRASPEIAPSFSESSISVLDQIGKYNRFKEMFSPSSALEE